jgi:hypothetical protein
MECEAFFPQPKQTEWAGMKCSHCGVKKKDHKISSVRVSDSKSDWRSDSLSSVVCPLDTPRFLELQMCKRRAGSGPDSPGIYYLRTPNGMLVAKSSKMMLQDALASVFAHEVRLRLTSMNDTSNPFWSIPTMRLICTGSRDHAQLITGLRRLGSKGVLEPHNLPLVGEEVIMLLEYLKGENMLELTHEQLRVALSPATLHCIGSMLVVDLVINNWDRIPLAQNQIWPNEGNLANLFFQNSQLVLIDQTVTAIIGSSMRRRGYLANVAAFVTQILSAEREHSTPCPFAQLRAYFSATLQIDIGAQGQTHLRQGFLQSLRYLCAGSSDFSDEPTSSLGDARDSNPCGLTQALSASVAALASTMQGGIVYPPFVELSSVDEKAEPVVQPASQDIAAYEVALVRDVCVGVGNHVFTLIENYPSLHSCCEIIMIILFLYYYFHRHNVIII